MQFSVETVSYSRIKSFALAAKKAGLSMLDNESVTWFAAIDSDTKAILGFIATLKTKGTIRSKSLYVEPEFRGHGIARAMLTTSMKQVKKDYILGKTDADKITAFCNANSLHLYLSVGFIDEGNKNASGASYVYYPLN